MDIPSGGKGALKEVGGKRAVRASSVLPKADALCPMEFTLGQGSGDDHMERGC